MRLFTIGFTRKSAQAFFTTLAAAGVKHLIDVRLNNLSQLAGFTKRDDLAFFARAVCGISYTHMAALAPTQEMLTDYRKNKKGWPAYARQFEALMASRRIEEMDRAPFDRGCLLCSEPTPHRCHRRLVAEYLGRHWANVSVTHL